MPLNGLWKGQEKLLRPPCLSLFPVFPILPLMLLWLEGLSPTNVPKCEMPSPAQTLSSYEAKELVTQALEEPTEL